MQKQKQQMKLSFWSATAPPAWSNKCPDTAVRNHSFTFGLKVWAVNTDGSQLTYENTVAQTNMINNMIVALKYKNVLYLSQVSMF